MRAGREAVRFQKRMTCCTCSLRSWAWAFVPHCDVPLAIRARVQGLVRDPATPALIRSTIEPARNRHLIVLRPLLRRHAHTGAIVPSGPREDWRGASSPFGSFDESVHRNLQGRSSKRPLVGTYPPPLVTVDQFLRRDCRAKRRHRSDDRIWYAHPDSPHGPIFTAREKISDEEPSRRTAGRIPREAR
jgi:hypothetical protein